MRRTGREPAFENNQEGLETFVSLSDAYIDMVKEQGSVPSVEEWSYCIGVTRNTLINYSKCRPIYELVIKSYKEQIREIRRKQYSSLTRGLSEEQKKAIIERSASA